MSFGKEIIVLSGGRHKGVVKLQNALGKSGILKGTCSLDYIPHAAILYIVGDTITETPLNNYETIFETSDSVGNCLSCLILSGEPPMFGTSKNGALRATVTAQVEKYLKDKRSKPAGKFNESSDINTKNPDGEYIPSSPTPYGGKDKKNEVSDPDYSDKEEQEKYAFETDSSENVNRKIKSDEEQYRYDDSQKESDLYKDGENMDMRAESEETGGEDAEIYAADSAKEKPLGDWVKYDGNNFYLAIKPQLDEMFECYPDEKNLNATVPNSRWVKVDAEDGYYVVGLLYDGAAPSYICYGVPSRANVRPPEELDGMCVWLSLEGSGGKDADGYWVIYQSALNGEIIK